MEEKNLFVTYSFAFNRYNWLIPEYNEIIRRLRDAGITEHWNDFYTRKDKPDAFGPEVLTLAQLEFGFYGCMIPVVLPIFVFFCELKWLLITFVLKKIKNSVVKLFTGC